MVERVAGRAFGRFEPHERELSHKKKVIFLDAIR
jgi:hypothetical protein